MPYDPVTDADRAAAKSLVARVLVDIASGAFDERTPAYREEEVAAALAAARAEEREMCARMMDRSAEAATEHAVAFAYEHAAEAIRAAAGLNSAGERLEDAERCETLAAKLAEAQREAARQAELWRIADASDKQDYLRGKGPLERLLTNMDYDGLPERYKRLLHRDVALVIGERDRYQTAIECVLADMEGNADSRSRGNFTLIETKRIEVLRAALAADPNAPWNQKLTGTRCGVPGCGKPQFETPHGVVCDDGHGGAPPAPEAPACEWRSQADKGQRVCGKSPARMLRGGGAAYYCFDHAQRLEPCDPEGRAAGEAPRG